MTDNNRNVIEGNPTDDVERRALIQWGPDGLRKLRERQAKKEAFAEAQGVLLDLPELVQRQLWIEQLDGSRATEADRLRLWPRIAARDAGYRPYGFAMAFTELLEIERVGHCAAYKTDYWWNAEYGLWLPDARGNLMHRLLTQHFGRDLREWADSEGGQGVSLATLQQVIDFARRMPSIALSPADVDPSPPARFLRPEEIGKRPPRRWLARVNGARVLPASGIGAFYGYSESFKSYVAVNLAVALASGRTDLGGIALEADPEAWVLYVGAEDAAGLDQRIAAARRQLGAEGARVLLYDQPVVMTDGEAVLGFVQQAKQLLPRDARVAAIVLDTYNQTLGPRDEENSADTARNYTINMRLLERALGGIVVTIHHPTKGDGDQMRGSGALENNVDFALRFERDEQGTKARVSPKKTKNGPTFPPFTLAFAESDDGLVLAGCEAAKPRTEKKGKAPADPDQLAKKIEQAFALLHRTGLKGVRRTDWEDGIVAALGCSARTAQRHIAALCSPGVGLAAKDEDGVYRVTDRGRDYGAARSWHIAGPSGLSGK